MAAWTELLRKQIHSAAGHDPSFRFRELPTASAVQDIVSGHTHELHGLKASRPCHDLDHIQRAAIGLSRLVHLALLAERAAEKIESLHKRFAKIFASLLH